MFKFLLVVVLGICAVAGHPVGLQEPAQVDEASQTTQSHLDTSQVSEAAVVTEYVKDFDNQNAGTFEYPTSNQIPYLSVQHNVLQEGVADVKSLQEIKFTNDLAVADDAEQSLDTSAVYYNGENDKQEQLSHSVQFLKTTEFLEPVQAQELTTVEPKLYNQVQNVEIALEEDGISQSVKDSTLVSSVQDVESLQNVQSVTSFGVQYAKPFEHVKTNNANDFHGVTEFEKLSRENNVDNVESVSKSSVVQGANFANKIRYLQPLTSLHTKTPVQVLAAAQTVAPLQKSESLIFENPTTISHQENHLQQSKVYDTAYEFKSDVRPDGFEYIMDAGNSIRSHAVGDEYGNVFGGYEWISPEGVHVKVDYKADENGYHPVGDLLPTPPPIPAAILRSLEYIRLHSPHDQLQNH